MKKKQSDEFSDFPAEEIPFQQVIAALLDEATPFPPRYLYRFSDLEEADLEQLTQVWPEVALWRRQALMEDLQFQAEEDTLLSFEAVGRLGLADEDPQVRFGAVQTLIASECDGRDLIEVYLGLVEDDQVPDVRAIAAEALGPFVYSAELERLPQRVQADLETRLIRAARSDPQDVVRRSALEALGFSSRPEVTALIEEAYRSPDPEWQASALFAMGRSANEAWRGPVVKGLAHAAPEVRLEAARAAGELALEEARPALFRLADDVDADVGMAAVWSLSQIGGRGVQELLARRMKRAESDEEIAFLEAALENLAFSNDLPGFGEVDFTSEDEETGEGGWEVEEDWDDELDEFESDELDDDFIEETLDEDDDFEDKEEDPDD
jgi:hypothetical protein